jgi:hypothetical protein
MAHVIVDRRLNDKGKSSVNRRKFIDRVRHHVKKSIQESIRDNNLDDLTNGDKKRIRIPIRNIDEPWFHHNNSGIGDIVRPGNDKFVPGDKIRRPEEGEGKGRQGSEDGEGDDTFVFHLTKEEFLEFFFENCELPDLVKKNLAIVNEEELRRTGHTSDGPPATLNIERSMRRAKSRRFALSAMKRKHLRELEEQFQLVIEQLKSSPDDDQLIELRDKLEQDIHVAKKRIESVPFLDPMDLKYNHWSKVSTPTTQAVIFRLMDVSGSMTENTKELAKTFFILLQLFIEKHYAHVAIVNIIYHSRASVTTDNDFFYGSETGGTVTSPALKIVEELIKDKYPTDMWNAYVAHATDGDNFASDNAAVEERIVTLLPKLQYYAYIQINDEESAAWRGHIHDPNNLWDLFEAAKNKHSNLNCALVESAKDVYPVFTKLFERQPS